MNCGKLIVLPDASVFTVELTQVQLLQLTADLLTDIPNGALGDSDQQQGQPAYQNVRAVCTFPSGDRPGAGPECFSRSGTRPLIPGAIFSRTAAHRGQEYISNYFPLLV